MSRNRKKKAIPDDFISFEDIDFDVDFLFDEIPNDEDLPTCGEQSNDDTIGHTEVEDEIETTTSTFNTNQQAEQTLPKNMSSLTQRTVHKCDHCKKVYMTLSGRLRHETKVHTDANIHQHDSSSVEKPKGKTPEGIFLKTFLKTCINYYWLAFECADEIFESYIAINIMTIQV